MTLSWLTILPPVLAILLAITTRKIYLSLLAGIWLGWLIISNWRPLDGTWMALNSLINVFSSSSKTNVILFCLLVGSLITLTQASGGVQGFINLILGKKIIISRRYAQILSWVIGLIVFIESSITSLIVGTASRPLYDKLKISREKLAYICDSTASPVCILIPLNAWGAYIIGLLEEQKISSPIRVLVNAIPFNLYAWLTILMVLLIIVSQKDFGPMKKAELRAKNEGKVLRDGAKPMVSSKIINIQPKKEIKPKAMNMVLPVLSMIVAMPIGLLITGRGNITAGSGSTSVLWAVATSILIASFLYLFQGIMSLKEIVSFILKGIIGLIPLACLMVLAFAIGETCNQLGTGAFVSRLTTQFIKPGVLPALLFLTSAFIAFATGTSWGTFAIMVPIGLPTAFLAGVNPSLILAAILGGGVFGDHASPISDTTLVASMASASDHIDHVNTQLPYALTTASLALIGYLINGLFL
ncbi:MAG: Na+/H+ antiporter NhaC family protein [Candidatus Aminicenantia bacterium]